MKNTIFFVVIITIYNVFFANGLIENHIVEGKLVMNRYDDENRKILHHSISQLPIFVININTFVPIPFTIFDTFLELIIQYLTLTWFYNFNLSTHTFISNVTPYRKRLFNVINRVQCSIINQNNLIFMVHHKKKILQHFNFISDIEKKNGKY